MLTLPSVGLRALGKGFAECPDTRQSSYVASGALPSVSSLNFCRGSASDTRQSPRARLLPRVHFAECWTLALDKVPATG